jgi:hypothetical protein
MAAGVGEIFDNRGILASRDVIKGNEVQKRTIMVNGNKSTMDRNVVNSRDKISVPAADGKA